jgi:hypothetical protein
MNKGTIYSGLPVQRQAIYCMGTRLQAKTLASICAKSTPQAATPRKHSFGAFLSSYFCIFNPLSNN